MSLDLGRCHVLWVNTYHSMTKELFETKPKVYNFMKFIAEVMHLCNRNDKGNYVPQIILKWHKPTKNQTKAKFRSWNDDLDFDAEVKRILSYINEWDLQDLEGIEDFKTSMLKQLEVFNNENNDNSTNVVGKSVELVR